MQTLYLGTHRWRCKGFRIGVETIDLQSQIDRKTQPQQIGQHQQGRHLPYHCEENERDQRQTRNSACKVKRAGHLMRGEKQRRPDKIRSEEHTSELQSLMSSTYAVFCLKTKKKSI